MKKYRILAMLGIMALTAGSMLAQDYDDIYYDASKSKTQVKTKVETPEKTVAVYGDVPERYKVAAQDNYRVERDVDEYNRRGNYGKMYDIDINGDTIYLDNDSIYNDSIYDEAFANTRRIERFYNPDIIILSDDDELVELYYDDTPTINLIVGSDWGFGSSYGWGYTSFYPWYTGWYDPWYIGWYDPWYVSYGWYSPWHWHTPWYYGYYTPWYYGYYSPWYYSHWHTPYWGYDGWNHWNWNNGTASWVRPHSARTGHYSAGNWMHDQRHVGLAANRNDRGRVDRTGSNRNSIAARGTDAGRKTGSVGNRRGYASSRGGGNMDTRRSSGVTTRNSTSGISSSAGSRSYGGRSSSSYGGSTSRSYGGSSSSSGSSYGGSSRSYGGSSSSSSGSRSSGSSYSGGSSRGSSGGGGSHGGSSGGGGRRR